LAQDDTIAGAAENCRLTAALTGMRCEASSVLDPIARVEREP
jgi:hypothetical protein